MIPIMTNEMEIFAVVCVRSVLSSSNIISRPTTHPLEWRQQNPSVPKPALVDEPVIQKMTLISMPHSTISQMVRSPKGTPFLMIAIEAMPSELVRQFTLLREVDAKYSGTPKSYYSNFKTFKQKSPLKSIPF